MESNSGNSFQYKLLQALNTQDPSSNILISPISLYLALIICAKGAKGKTANEIYSTIDKAKTAEQITRDCLKHIKALSSKSLTSASIVLSKELLLPEYEQICKQFNVDTGKLESVEAVNAWCAKQTHDKIKSILDSIENVKLLVLNAIYFEGKWKKPFKHNLTNKDTFTNSNGKQMKCRMMQGVDLQIGYYSNDNCQIAQLEYCDETIKAYLILPKGDINDYLSTTSSSQLETEIASCKKKSVNLKMPAFKLESSMDLRDVIKDMGIQTAFSPKANFSSMTKEKVSIDEVIQKTYMSVDEDGTIATVVTAVKTKGATKSNSESISMKVNKPFLFIVESWQVKENHLFIAKVEKVEP